MSVFQSAPIAGFKNLLQPTQRAMVCVIAVLLLASTMGRSAWAAIVCPGDCDGDGQATVDEITLIVNITLGIQAISSCPIFSQRPDVADIVKAVSSALMGCPQATPTPSASQTPFPTRTPVVFQAAEGSRIFYSEGEGVAPSGEPLSGTFAFRLLGSLEPQFFNIDVADVNLSSPQFSVVAQTPGQSGRVRMGLSCVSEALMKFDVLINTEPLPLVGRAPIDSCPPDITTIQPFELCTIAPTPCEAIREGTRRGYSVEIVPVVSVVNSTEAKMTIATASPLKKSESTFEL